MTKNRKYVQGIYTPINKNKTSGTIIYRSSLELKLCRWLDKNPKVIKWISERVILPYVSPLDGRVHKYFVDFAAHLKGENEVIKKLLIEVKPYKQTLQPVKTPRKKINTLIAEQRTYATNIAKWDAAMKWAKKNNYKFIIITDKHLK